MGPGEGPVRRPGSPGAWGVFTLGRAQSRVTTTVSDLTLPEKIGGEGNIDLQYGDRLGVGTEKGLVVVRDGPSLRGPAEVRLGSRHAPLVTLFIVSTTRSGKGHVVY